LVITSFGVGQTSRKKSSKVSYEIDQTEHYYQKKIHFYGCSQQMKKFGEDVMDIFGQQISVGIILTLRAVTRQLQYVPKNNGERV